MMINMRINQKEIQVEEGSTLLEAARRYHIDIPHLCSLEGVHRAGSCRICVVEVEGSKNLQAACITQVREGMVVQTHSERVRNARKMIYRLMLSDHPADCLNCTRNQNCELQRLGEQIGEIGELFDSQPTIRPVDDSSPSIVRDLSKCILCRRCVAVCRDIQGVGILGAQNRGIDTIVGPGEGLLLDSVNCTLCGQCTTVCPVGALKEKDSLGAVWEALSNKNRQVVVQTAPAVRAALGEEFGYPPGTLVTGKMVTALRELGFSVVFDTNFAADLTILEEGNELLERLLASTKGGEAVLPMITSCSPGWIKYAEHMWPKELDHLSTCKSPHMMLGALVKTYYAEKTGKAPKDFFVVSVMPCTAKKFEITRPEMKSRGLADVDAVLTTRELARMIRSAGIDFRGLEEGEFDNPLGMSTGAADIFGTTGGVMEAAIRTVYEVVTGRELPFDGLHVAPIMGLEQVKTVELRIEEPLEAFSMLEGVLLRVAVTSGLKGAAALMEQVAAGTSPYHFIEVMGCPGGCISGGGQPRMTDDSVRQKRMEAIYREDEGKVLRKSHENPSVQTLYREFLGRPLGHLSHELLHTCYTPRGSFNEYLK